MKNFNQLVFDISLYVLVGGSIFHVKVFSSPMMGKKPMTNIPACAFGSILGLTFEMNDSFIKYSNQLISNLINLSINKH